MNLLPLQQTSLQIIHLQQLVIVCSKLCWQCYYIPILRGHAYFCPVYVFQLCQTVRLVPSAFLEFRKVLVNECRKTCGLRLAQARTLIKIDVNKTRKLYDFLLSEGQITKP
jgi:hypothetical protein